MKTKVTTWGELKPDDICIDIYDGELYQLHNTNTSPVEKGGWIRYSVQCINNPSTFDVKYIMEYYDSTNDEYRETYITRKPSDLVAKIIF